jgi:hypothetical protein
MKLYHRMTPVIFAGMLAFAYPAYSQGAGTGGSTGASGTNNSGTSMGTAGSGTSSDMSTTGKTTTSRTGGGTDSLSGGLAGSRNTTGSGMGSGSDSMTGSDAARSGTSSNNWSAEDRYWRENYSTRPYYRQGQDYTTYEPAYRYGADLYERNEGKRYDQLSRDEIESGWDDARGESDMNWTQAEQATRDAYNRVYNNRANRTHSSSSTSSNTTTGTGSSAVR